MSAKADVVRLAALGAKPCSNSSSSPNTSPCTMRSNLSERLPASGLSSICTRGSTCSPSPAGPRAKQKIDGVGRIARLEHPFAGGKRTQLQARAADQLMRGISGSAHQR